MILILLEVNEENNRADKKYLKGKSEAIKVSPSSKSLVISESRSSDNDNKNTNDS
jgi:hypothetical protein